MIGERRQRAIELRERHLFAGEVLTLYLGLLDVWEEAAQAAPPPEALAEWAAEHVLPGVVEATVAAGPAALGEAVRERVAPNALAGWLAGDELDPVDRYLARASLAPLLEALGDEAGAACTHNGDPAAAGHPAGAVAGQRCPHCGGPPQLGCLEASGEALVSGGRSLLCARCASTWSGSRGVCPACGERDEARLVVYAEQWQGNGDGEPVFPHMRVAGCTTCRRYLIDVDLQRDGRAVPDVDELAALPLGLYAADQGLTKVTPNLMGF